MINLESRDSQIWNIDKKIIEIIKEGTSSNNKIIISTTNEGICLRSCYFYDLLDNICDTFNIDKNRIEITTSNVEEFHSEYKIVILPNVHVRLNQKEPINPEPKNLNLLSIGCFVGKINWARLALLSWLDQYPGKSLITCHYKYDDSDLTSKSSLQLNDNFLKLPNETVAAVKFLNTCPRLLSTNFKIPYDKIQKATNDDIFNIAGKFSEGYSDIFAELVCETYFTGFTFFPTEKTFRPIQQLTPFIIFGPQGFLTNLHRCGFKTFGNYWDEGYDECVGVDRILKIRQIILQLFELDQFALQQMYADMKPILEHNKNRFLELTPEELYLDE
jgi:hypothetical protein